MLIGSYQYGYQIELLGLTGLLIHFFMNLHAFSYLNRNCVAPDGTNKRRQAQEYFGSEELFADSLVLYFGGDYVFYRETNSLSDAENAYLQEFINLCT